MPMLVSYPELRVNPSSAGKDRVPGSWITSRMPVPSTNSFTCSNVSTCNIIFNPFKCKSKIQFVTPLAYFYFSLKGHLT